MHCCYTAAFLAWSSCSSCVHFSALHNDQLIILCLVRASKLENENIEELPEIPDKRYWQIITFGCWLTASTKSHMKHSVRSRSCMWLKGAVICHQAPPRTAQEQNPWTAPHHPALQQPQPPPEQRPKQLPHTWHPAQLQLRHPLNPTLSST